MAQQAPSKNWKAWFEKQAQLQEDGTYLIRLRWWGHRSGIYQIDADTKRRWVQFQIASRWLGIALGLLLIVLKGDDPWDSWRVILLGVLVFAVALMMGYGGSFVILRHAPRVPKDRWTGPAVVDWWGPVSRRRSRMMMIWWGVITAAFAWWSMFSAPAGSFWQTAPIILLFGAFFVFSLLRYRHAGRGRS